MGQALATEQWKYAVYRFQEVPDYRPGLASPERSMELYDLERDPVNCTIWSMTPITRRLW
jgi:hypothetical protein